MSPLPIPREVALARVLAMGRSRSMARGEAGYAKHWKHVRTRVARPDIVAGEVIGALTLLAGKAGQMRSAAAMVAARGLVAEAAKLDLRTFERRGTADVNSIS